MSAGGSVSVITPSYNQVRYLGEALSSVAKQTFGPVEHIVIDGKSTDGSRCVLEAYQQHLAHWISEPDRGQSHAFNKGLRLSTGNIIGWLNSDDFYFPTAVAGAVAFFNDNPGCDIVFSDYVFVDEQSEVLSYRKEPRFSYQTSLWTHDCYHANCAGFFRRRVFDAVGGLDESLHFGMDYEFYLRAARAGFRFGHVPAVWGAYRLHNASKSVTASDEQRKDAERIFLHYAPPGTTQTKAMVLKWLWGANRVTRKLLLGSYLVRKWRRDPGRA